jgi:NADH:ubiquinone oxidoreductase subunit 5 (subunit L)/multisubunit Na+/H+ antiporter MnhA subunit
VRCSCSCVFDLAALAGALPGEVDYGEWLAIGAVPVRLSFVLDAYSLPSATLVTLITWMALRFSATYLHREAVLPASSSACACSSPACC